jgi:hypothetical protein
MTKMEGFLGKVRHWIKPWMAGAEPMEIRRAILEDVGSRIVAVGGGKRVFPFNRVTVHLRADDSEERAAMEAVVREGWDLERDIPERLRELDARVPPDLEVLARIEEGSPANTEFGDRRFRVTYERTESAGATVTEVGSPAGAARPTLELTVVQGTATQRVYTSTADRVYIGRLREVLDPEGRVKRRNDVAFLDEGEINQTVSREHARILWDQEARSFWLRAEQKGTRVFRDGRTLEVSPQDRRGVRLQPGDEVYVGRASLKVGVRAEG